MKRLRLPIALAALLAVPTAFAAEIVRWDLRGSVPAGVAAHNLTTIELTDEGVYIDTATDGFLQLPFLSTRADAVRLRVTNARATEIAVIWRTPALNPGEYYQHNVVLPAGEGVEASAALHQVPDWTWNATFVGIAFPAGTKILLEEIEWRGYTFMERLRHGFASFWTPDDFRLYSINFLWGPLIASTPEARETLFETMPPRSWSATRIFYGAFLVAAVVAGVIAWRRPHDRRRRFLLGLAIAGSALWMLFDARMTQEIFSYVRDDWRSYILATENRSLRTHSSLYDVLDRAKELVRDGDRYALIAKEGAPFFANVRYALYPAMPVRQEEWNEDIPVWIILASPQVTVRDGALVSADGTVLARGGDVVERFDESSFMYRVRP